MKQLAVFALRSISVNSALGHAYRVVDVADDPSWRVSNKKLNRLRSRANKENPFSPTGVLSHHSETEPVSPFFFGLRPVSVVERCRARAPRTVHGPGTGLWTEDDRMDQNEREKGSAEKPKPIPIREAVGEPRPRPTGVSDVSQAESTSPAPGLRGQRERPGGPNWKGPSHKSEGPQRFSPQERSPASEGDEPPRPPLEPTAVEDFPGRSFEHEGCEWIVRLSGMTSTGSVRDSGTLLLHLLFYAADDPLVACGEVLVPGRSLEAISELELSELVSEARSAPTTNEPSR
jgi:hypothetical protein